MLRDYKKSFNRDVNYGVTNIGVHLDDYIFELDGKLAKEYLSEGEQKSAVIAFKLSEHELEKKFSDTLKKGYQKGFRSNKYKKIPNLKINTNKSCCQSNSESFLVIILLLYIV